MSTCLVELLGSCVSANADKRPANAAALADRLKAQQRVTRDLSHVPRWPGWHLLGSFPEGDPNGVGSWLLHCGGEALLLQVPPGLTADTVKSALQEVKAKLLYATASHDHEDSLDPDTWETMERAFPSAEFLHPSRIKAKRDDDKVVYVGGEPIFLVKAPKHSLTDVVTIFRGVAMTGDIELRMLESVTDEVPLAKRRQSMDRLRDFQDRQEYDVHSTVSAHLNTVQQGVNWPELFSYESED